MLVKVTDSRPQVKVLYTRPHTHRGYRRGNFGIRLLLSQNWGACVYTKIWEEKNAGTQSFQDCIIKGLIRCESISAGLDAVSKIGYFIDDINGLRTDGVGGGKYVGLYKKERIRGQVILN